MTAELSPFQKAAIELLDKAREARDEEITARAMLDFERQQRADAQASVSMLLGRETLALIKRMMWLDRHPRRPKFLGGSAINMNYADHAISTPLLLATEAEHPGGIAIKDGYIFSLSSQDPYMPGLTIYLPHHALAITHQVVDDYAGESVTSDKSVIYIQHDMREVLSIQVNSLSVEWYEADANQAIDEGHYQDELMFSMGLVMQAHDEIGRTKRG